MQVARRGNPPGDVFWCALICGGCRSAKTDPFRRLLQGVPDKGLLPGQVFFPPGVLRVCRRQGLFCPHNSCRKQRAPGFRCSFRGGNGSRAPPGPGVFRVSGRNCGQLRRYPRWALRRSPGRRCCLCAGCPPPRPPEWPKASGWSLPLPFPRLFHGDKGPRSPALSRAWRHLLTDRYITRK